LLLFTIVAQFFPTLPAILALSLLLYCVLKKTLQEWMIWWPTFIPGNIEVVFQNVKTSLSVLYDQLKQGLAMALDVLQKRPADIPAIPTTPVGPTTSEESGPLVPDAFQTRRAYPIHNQGKWKEFTSLLRATDILITFMGTTGAGKSSTINKLAEIPEGHKIKTGCTTNNSTFPYVVLWEEGNPERGGGRIFLVDWPGFGAKIEDGFNGWVTDVPGALGQLRGSVACAVLVTRCARTDDQLATLTQLQENGLKVIVAINDDLDVTEHLADRVAQWKEKERITDVVTYNASARGENPYNPKSTFNNLASYIKRYVADRAEEINTAAAASAALERRKERVMNFERQSKIDAAVTAGVVIGTFAVAVTVAEVAVVMAPIATVAFMGRMYKRIWDHSRMSNP